MHKYTGFALLVLGGCISLGGMVLPANGQGVVVSNDSTVVSTGSLNLSAQSFGNSFGDSGGALGAEAGFAGAVGDVSLSGMNAPGAMSAGRDINCRTCRIEGNVSAGRDIRLEHSPQVGSVAAGHDVALLDSHVLGSISAGHGVTLAQSQVQGNLSTGNEADLQGSAVQGSLSQGGHRLKLDASIIQQDVYFQGRSPQLALGGQSSLIRNRNGLSFVRVGVHGLSRVNGFTIQGAEQQTTVITPQQAIYVNGKKVSGDGPKSYARYCAENPAAPSVEGPGWPEGGAAATDDPETGGKSASLKYSSSRANAGSAHQPVLNWLELSNQSRINGQVVFESGFGKVLLHPGSHVTGPVVNGTVEQLPN